MAVNGIFDNNLTEPKKDTSKFSTLSNNLNGGLFSNIKTGESATGDAAVSNVNDMLSGDSYDAYKAQANQKLSRAIANLRNSVGTQYGGSVGQGSYTRAQQGAEQSIFSQMADNNLQADVEKQAMKERGITAAQGLAQAEATNTQNNMQTAMASDTAYGYTDAFGNKIRGSNELAGTQTDIQQQQANTQRDLGYAQIGSSEKIAGMNITSNERIASNQLNESARQFNISNDTDKQQFAATLQKEYAQLSQQEKQFLANFGLDEAKFNQAKSEYTQNLNLEYTKLASNEKIATDQLGVEKSKLEETARQFNISTQEAAYQFTQKLNFDYASLSQQDRQYLTSLGFDREKFEESKRQYDTTTALEDKYRTKDLDLKEQSLAQEASQFNSRLAFDKWATEKGLEDAAANRIWQATQNDNALANSKYIAEMQNNTEVWKTNKVDELTRAGWTVEDARASADREQQLTLATISNALTREIEAGRITQQEADRFETIRQFDNQQAWLQEAKKLDIAEADAQRLWATNERLGAEAATAAQNTYQAQLQKELASGTWTDANGVQVTSIQAQELLQQASQFKDQLDWEKKAKELDISEADAQRIWATNERIENNLHQAQMQQIENAFAEKGWNFQGLYASLESLPEEQAASILKTIAVNSGITHLAKDANGNLLTDSKGNNIVVPGFEDVANQKMLESETELQKLMNLDLSGFDSPDEAGKAIVNWVSNNKLSNTNVAKIADGWDGYVEEYPGSFVSGNEVESFETVTYKTKGGLNRWALSDAASDWVSKNAGKLYKASDGKVYVVMGSTSYTDRNSTQKLLFKDVTTGNIVEYSQGGGGSEQVKFA